VDDSISLAGDKTASAALFEGRGELKGDRAIEAAN